MAWHSISIEKFGLLWAADMNIRNQASRNGGATRLVTLSSFAISALALVTAISQSPSLTGTDATLAYYHLRENQGKQNRVWRATTRIRIENTSDQVARDVTVTINPLPENDNEIICETSFRESDGAESTRVVSISRLQPRSIVELVIRVGHVSGWPDETHSRTWYGAPTIRQVSYQGSVVACDYTRCEADLENPGGQPSPIH
jgi:hypothetical protein